jgi:hypothetical protein
MILGEEENLYPEKLQLRNILKGHKVIAGIDQQPREEARTVEPAPRCGTVS